MLARIHTASISGIEGKCVTVEADITRGLPGFYLVGLGILPLRRQVRE